MNKIQSAAISTSYNFLTFKKLWNDSELMSTASHLISFKHFGGFYNENVLQMEPSWYRCPGLDWKIKIRLQQVHGGRSEKPSAW